MQISYLIYKPAENQYYTGPDVPYEWTRSIEACYHFPSRADAERALFNMRGTLERGDHFQIIEAVHTTSYSPDHQEFNPYQAIQP